MKEGYSEPYPPSSKKDSTSEEDDDDNESRLMAHDLLFDSPNRHHYVVGAKSLNYVMQ